MTGSQFLHVTYMMTDATFCHRNLLLGLACNESTSDIELDLSCNNLGAQGAHVFESCIHGVRCIGSLDISDNSKTFTKFSRNLRTVNDVIIINHLLIFNSLFFRHGC